MDTKTTQSNLSVGGSCCCDYKGRARASTGCRDTWNVFTFLHTTHLYVVVHTRFNYKNNDDESRDDNNCHPKFDAFYVRSHALGTSDRTSIDFTNGKLHYL